MPSRVADLHKDVLGDIRSTCADLGLRRETAPAGIVATKRVSQGRVEEGRRSLGLV